MPPTYPDREALNAACRATREAAAEWEHAIIVMREAYARVKSFWLARPFGSSTPKSYQQEVAEMDHDAALAEAKAAGKRHQAAEAQERRVREERFPCRVVRGPVVAGTVAQREGVTQ